MRYIDQLLGLEPGHVIALWPLNELSGGIAYDVSGHGFNGSINGATPGQPGIGDGETAYSFDGNNDYVAIYSAALAGAFNPAEGSIAIWAKVLNASIWSDGQNRYNIAFYTDNSNVLLIRKLSTPNNTLYFAYTAGGTTKSVITTNASAGWLCLALTWSKSAGANGELKAYLNGAQVGDTQTALGNWVGPIVSATIGSWILPAFHWSGLLGRVALYDVALSPAQIAAASRLNPGGPSISVVEQTISTVVSEGMP